METPKLLCYVAMIAAGLISLIFVLDLALGILSSSAGRNYALDIMFILGAAFVLWQGFETTRELR
jgi:threonine/homoserine/homoserine lactone efflux protein